MNDEVNRLANDANRLMQAGRLHEAVPILRQITNLAPQWAEGFMQFGSVLHNLQKYEEAAAAFHTASELQPNGQIYDLLGRSLLAAKDLVSAEAALRRAIGFGTNRETAIVLVTLLMERVRYKEAMDVLSDLMSSAPNWPPAIYYSGLVRYRQKLYQDAVPYFRRLSPGTKEATIFLAKALGNLGDVAAASDALREAGLKTEADRMSLTLTTAKILSLRGHGSS